MKNLRTILLLAFIVGTYGLIFYGFGNSRIFRIILYTAFGIIAEYYIVFMTIAEIGLWLDDKKRERERERLGDK